MKKINPVNLLLKNVHLLILIFIIYIGLYIRLTTVNTKINLDYDPWWYYRYAKYLVDHNLQSPKWDILSFFPPGRPVTDPLGWEYTVAISYKILSIFTHVDFMRVCIWAPAIVGCLVAIPAYLTGKEITNKWGGIITALFAVTSPHFLSISMAGYMDTDAIVTFYTFACAFTLLYALRKRTKFSYILSILSLWAFAFSYAESWYVLDIFAAFLMTYFIVSIFLSYFFKKLKEKGTSFSIILKQKFRQFKPYFITFILITIASSVLSVISGVSDPITAFISGSEFLGGQMIVNFSIAELQIVNIFSKDGFLQIAGEIGLSIYFAIALPIIILIKLKTKQKINFGEIFVIIWLITTFYLIIHGIRFSLQFMCATAAASSVVIGNLSNFLNIWKSKTPSIINLTIIGIVVMLLIMELSTTLVYSNQMTGMEVDDNWVGMLDWLKNNANNNSLIATWWDPGHIITGYTGLKVHADGAHCSPEQCIPYDHNIRIQNMGRIMSTSDESEALNILKKYVQLTPQQCQEVKQKFGSIVPKEACEPISEMYLISSNDLIGKFTWMDYYGGYRAPIKSNEDFQANPGVCCASTPPTEPGQASCGEFASQGKGVWIWCPWIFSFSNVTQDQDGNPVYIYDYAGLTIAILQKNNQLIPIYNNRFLINHLTLFPQGSSTSRTFDLSNITTSLEKNDGLIWIDPSFQNLIYFAPSIKDSIFTRTFFYDGEGLKNFKLVYSNPEIKLYKVNFGK